MKIIEDQEKQIDVLYAMIQKDQLMEE